MSIYANQRRGRRGPGSLLKREERRVYKAAAKEKKKKGKWASTVKGLTA
jgi:hypothetical protein